MGRDPQRSIISSEQYEGLCNGLLRNCSTESLPDKLNCSLT
jgi:hypothetical protein